MKPWQTPKLIALVRNDPQEAVLSYCKGNPALAAGVAVEPSTSNTGCMQMQAMANIPQCMTCSSTSAS